jgi:hypothetical protein
LESRHDQSPYLHGIGRRCGDRSWQMGMQAGLLALIDSVDAFGKEDFVPDLRR